MTHFKPAAAGMVQLGGLIGSALEANRSGRLAQFITGPASPAIAIFDPARVLSNQEGDWYGEHAGKWLYAAAKALARRPDPELAAKLCEVADHLVSLQASDGYLGNYAPERRFMQKQALKASLPKTWDGAPSLRTWDIWTHSYMVLGLLEVDKVIGQPAAQPRYLAAACKIGDLCWHTMTFGGINITELGNHHGMSATVLLDPAVELYFATGEQRYLDLALLVLEQAEANPDLALLSRALAGADASEIATGKAYQLAWNLVGLAKLYRATGVASYREAVDKLWENMRSQHLSLGGGPWGGVAHRSREVFNPAGVFSPQGYVETCATLAWLQLNRELLSLSGEARYADEIERTAYNDLLGAMAPNGEDWCYYSFPNGRRVHTTYWRCCKSSGAMALEELPALAYGSDGDGGLKVNVYGPGQAKLALHDIGIVTLTQSTRYPADGLIELRVDLMQSARFCISLRIPAWAASAQIEVNGLDAGVLARPGSYAELKRLWHSGDNVTLQLPMPPVLHKRQHQNVQESRAPDGSAVRQQVLSHAFAAITRGPLVYATGLIDGFKTEESIRLLDGESSNNLQLMPSDSDAEPAIRLRLCDRPDLRFSPYYRAGSRRDGSWHLTWLTLAPELDANLDEPIHGNS